jgi:phytoene/squalene synthetase
MNESAALARSITRNASRSTDLILRWLADPDLRDDAYRAYGYFRWLDDALDGDSLNPEARLELLRRQRALLATPEAGDTFAPISPEEQLLVDLLVSGHSSHGGLHSYLHCMMDVMEFDARRRGRTVTARELTAYTRNLSRAVMDGLSYFVGHRVVYPATPGRLMAVTGAHIVHMLRDAAEDVTAGYFNVPREFLEARHLSPHDLDAPGYHEWMQDRLDLARRCFSQGRAYIRSFRNLRVRWAGWVYCLRFERTLRALQRQWSVAGGEWWAGVALTDHSPLTTDHFSWTARLDGSR